MCSSGGDGSLAVQEEVEEGVNMRGLHSHY